ncbi:MAG: DoxX family protein [Sediminibacterium sp.]|nr:DoxX family protein [uncultured Sediminibacterium sp.]
MKTWFFRTNNSYAPIVARIFLAWTLFPHGAQKLLGWYGGFGFTNSMKYFTESVGLPPVIGFLVIIIECFGPLFILFGLATRLWSFAIATVMFGIIVTNFHTYFFMNWFGTQPQEGYEFFLLAIGIALSLVISGGGRFSADAVIMRNKSKATL